MTNEHFSFVIYGDRENRWAGYAFDDTKSDGDDLQDKIYCEGLHVDPICSGGLDDVDSELPIWDPREYFLNVVTTRVGLAADSWEALLRAIERRVKHYVGLNSVCNASTRGITLSNDDPIDRTISFNFVGWEKRRCRNGQDFRLDSADH